MSAYTCLPVKPGDMYIEGETCMPGHYAFSLRGTDRALMEAYLAYLKRAHADDINFCANVSKLHSKTGEHSYVAIVTFSNLDAYNALLDKAAGRTSRT